MSANTPPDQHMTPPSEGPKTAGEAAFAYNHTPPTPTRVRWSELSVESKSLWEGIAAAAIAHHEVSKEKEVTGNPWDALRIYGYKGGCVQTFLNAMFTKVGEALMLESMLKTSIAKQESAEAQLASLKEGQIGPTCQTCNWTNCRCLNLAGPGEDPRWMCHGCIKRMADDLKAKLAQSPWISTSERMPTREDGDKDGNVFWLYEKGDLSLYLELRKPMSRPWNDPRESTHWMTIPPVSNADAQKEEKPWTPKFKVGDRVRIKEYEKIYGSVYSTIHKVTKVIAERRRYKITAADYTTWPEDALELAQWTPPAPPEGQQWHRDDWTQEMLPDGWRPLLKGEAVDPSDESIRPNDSFGLNRWAQVGGMASTLADDAWRLNGWFLRTRRPLPAPPTPKKRVPLEDSLSELKSHLVTAELERDRLQSWKDQMLTVESWWSKVDEFIRNHPKVPIGQNVSDIALQWLRAYAEEKDKP